MIPIVFCASLAPCDSEKSAELTSCAPRKNRSTRAGGTFWKIQNTAVISMKPSAAPIIGESTMKSSVIGHLPFASTSPPNPAFATAAPAYAPISACEELDGSPTLHVTTFHAIAPSSPARITFGSTIAGGDESREHRLRHRRADDERRREVEERGPHHRLQRPQHPRADHRRDRVRRVVEAVAEVEQERDHDDRNDVVDHRTTRASTRCSRARSPRPRTDRARARACRTAPST